MPSITSWMRLEPVSRSVEMKTSLQARIYDPLWLLARQWQLGEFQGEDNGSPIMASWRGEGARITRYQSGGLEPGSSVSAPTYDVTRMPLETLVEREPVHLSTDRVAKPERLKLAVEAGLEFLRMVEQMFDDGMTSRNYRDDFIREFPFTISSQQRATLDNESLAFVDLMSSRVPDARLMIASFRSGAPDKVVIKPSLKITPGDVSEIQQAAQQWLKSSALFFSEPEALNPSWLPERLEYAFSVSGRFTEGERALTSQEYSEGHLDWYDFDVDPKLKLGAATDKAFDSITRTAIPAPVSFAGMPTPRFWEFEDAQVDFGSVDAGPTDLARMLLVEFALTYGNDWFVIPIELDVGSLYQTRSLVITDTFGVRTLIKSSSELPAPHSTWRMFQHSNLRASGVAGPAANLFFLTPSLLGGIESRPIEEVLFLRDEMANMAWGVERIVESATEEPLNRNETERQALPPPPAQRTDDKLVYKLATEVPGNWVPLLPVKTTTGLRLQRGKVLKIDGSSGFIEAHGRILNPDTKSLKLFEEEIPREGVRVTRHYQLARWHDGSTHLWIGRRKKVGTGEGSSGLRFDVLED
ncbi:MAG TPA: hypothetical protein VFT48_16895 [Pyrinomonadaceae bacterium]|nr:hypothetical protein [Pyrinomonadaceae bacterium]